MEDRLVRELFRGFIQLHILHHAGREAVYGQEFQHELARHGYRVSYGTLYPLFHRLQKNGYLDRRERQIGGKIRKYYTLTDLGRIVLEEARAKARELTEELYEE